MKFWHIQILVAFHPLLSVPYICYVQKLFKRLLPSSYIFAIAAEESAKGRQHRKLPSCLFISYFCALDTASPAEMKQ